MVVFFHADAACDGQRGMAGIGGRSGIAFLLGVVPVGLVTQEFQVDLPLLQLGFLEADKIGVERRENIGKSLLGDRPKAIDIPTDEFHIAKIRK